MKKQNVEEKLASSLTAETTELVPYLAYLLQDLWELGSIPAVMQELIEDHITTSRETKVLDLGCGKGAVAITLAKELGIKVKGIDLLPDFIEAAKQKAAEFQVANLCQFAVGDINQAVKEERDYDIVLFGAVGDVLGEVPVMLQQVKQTVKDHGFLLIDDAYLVGDAENIRYQNYEYLTLDQWEAAFQQAGFEVAAIQIVETTNEDEINKRNNQLIRQRAEELSRKYPDKQELFASYVQSQENETEDLSTDVVGATWLLQAR
ncbi:methyltransferase domain-containing protein [Enterococcus sp. 669A]|uniref:Methyltransferase domain-containing protein n=1 Tax=Candidatus Enterococcus moelleringii TaxID=2815325 RepID=A0ABS3L5D6_9ENTE|nr:class I SAM-dependent methyltransferase [Enterococcus sp. 669A]MBO1304828.1 methyltransferase domain-containing protein [Enterococcus sp. 669A]